MGEYEMGTPNGQGTITLPDGEQYVGEFKENQYHEQGIFTYDDGTVDKGIWKLDKLIELQQ